MAWQQADLDALDAALANNITEVSYADGRKVRYQDADKMLSVRREMKAELLASAAQVAPRRRVTQAVVRR